MQSKLPSSVPLAGYYTRASDTPQLRACSAAKLPAEARELLETVRGERDGLRGRVATMQARIRGIEERTPEHVTVYDTTNRLAHPCRSRCRNARNSCPTRASACTGSRATDRHGPSDSLPLPTVRLEARRQSRDPDLVAATSRRPTRAKE